ncbi:ATP-binding cassette, subfamily B, RaxB [Pseudomonas cuatrocienegasensis]|uniref:ATP-binding cassette, subfamily B, RaxB n=2 Tax=Pseudomonas TaxID=286 RepID=A0ABY1B5S3_9PSED|nr:ATP-binding cassette, subfamily B, RaxB [Pseudomonas cuatrocienegasensis]
MSVKGTGLNTLIGYAHELGYSSRALRLELYELSQLRMPCILHWDHNHFVVLEKISRGKIQILDPARGIRKLTESEVSDHFTGVALELNPNIGFQHSKPKDRIKIRDLLGRAVGLKRALGSILGLAVALEVITLLSPQITQWIVDSALVTADRDLLFLAVLGGGLLLVIDFVLRMARGWIGLRINQQLAIQWTSNVFGHLLKLPWPYFEKRQLGDISSRFHSLSAIRQFFANGAVMAVLDGGVAIITLAMMFLYSPALTAVVAVAILLYGILRAVFYYPLRMASEERIVLSARENSYFLESIRAVLPLKLFSTTSQRLSRWTNLLADVQNRDVLTQKLMLFFSSLNTLIFGMEGLVILFIGGHYVLDGTLTLGMLLAFIAYKTQFTGRASKLIDLSVEFRMLTLHAERLADIALEDPEPESPQETDISRLPASVEFRNVSFRYADGEPWVVKELNLMISPGETVAIVGRSGCGKSTLFKMILGLVRPTEGEILIGGIPLSQLGPTAARSMIGAVMQEDYLMAGSLSENIAFFDSDATQDDIESAAKKANIHKAIVNMPMGYQTLISEMGSGLSGGQKQRLLLARALYRKPRILALDEATSHLDIHSEQHVVSALNSINMTRILIAHRRETLVFATRVLFLEKGLIVQDLAPEKPIAEV